MTAYHAHHESPYADDCPTCAGMDDPAPVTRCPVCPASLRGEGVIEHLGTDWHAWTPAPRRSIVDRLLRRMTRHG